MRDAETIIDFCRNFRQLHPYPLHFYYDNQLMIDLPAFHIDLVAPFYEQILALEKQAFLFEIAENFMIGWVYSDDRRVLLLLGPALTATLTTANLHGIQQLYQLSSDSKDALVSYIGPGAGKTLFHFRTVLRLVNYFLNQTPSDESEASLYFANEEINKEIRKENLEKNAYEQQYASYRLAYEFEQNMLNAIKEGNEKVIGQVALSMSMHVGTLSSASVRQAKNQFICIATLATRAAIQGGLDLENAYSLSDSYIQKAEACTTCAPINELIDTMLLDFTVRTKQAKFNADVSGDLYLCIRFIRNNTHQPLSVRDVAKYAHLSVRQLDRKFSSDLGFCPKEFIMRCKLEEAKEMLTYTNKSLNEISQILCFSSQSYFNNVFKKHFNMTPGEFRKLQKT